MARRGAAAAIAALALAASASAAPPYAWRTDWNARIDQHERLRDHPCGDFAFEPWAGLFLAACDPAPAEREAECATRLDWVKARAAQCRVWKNWLLRNHNQRVRHDEVPEPPTRVR